MTSIDQLRQQHDELRAQGLKLDLTRGKPSPEQLDLSNALLSLPGEGDYRGADGTDLRNYGGPDGLEELRAIFGELLHIPTEQLLALDAVTLPIMHGTVRQRAAQRTAGRRRAVARRRGRHLPVPVPGYDRHFTICEALGIRMIAVPHGERRPSTWTIVEKLVADDASIKGMWCVPKYGNPTGYSLRR